MDAPRVGILLLTHMPLGEALLACVQHVFQCEVPQCAYIAVPADACTIDIYTQTLAAIAQLNTGAGVLILADIVGATPCNIANRLASLPQVKVLAGVNLPMLLRAVSYAGQDLPTVVEKAMEGGQMGIIQVASCDIAVSSRA